MAKHEYVKVAVKKAWIDIEPKVYAFLTTGAVLTAAAYVASLFNFSLPAWSTGAIIWGASWLAGYFKVNTVKLPSKALADAQLADAQGVSVGSTKEKSTPNPVATYVEPTDPAV